MFFFFLLILSLHVVSLYVVYEHNVHLNCIYYVYYTLLSQGYLVIGLEERMKYLRRPHKRGQVAMSSSSEGNPPAKRPPKPLMPQVVPVGMHATGEDDASHTRNIKMLQALSQQVLAFLS